MFEAGIKGIGVKKKSAQFSKQHTVKNPPSPKGKLQVQHAANVLVVGTNQSIISGGADTPNIADNSMMLKQSFHLKDDKTSLGTIKLITAEQQSIYNRFLPVNASQLKSPNPGAANIDKKPTLMLRPLQGIQSKQQQIMNQSINHSFA